MFFPAASARIACSFFKVPPNSQAAEVLIFPPVLRQELTVIRKIANPVNNKILVYLTAQDGFRQSPKQLLGALASQPETRFDVFLPDPQIIGKNHLPLNVTLYKHGDKNFRILLTNCVGIISTAGHSLLSEAMYLGIPVLALPLPLYEQQMNAHIIHANKFGLSARELTSENLELFIRNLPTFAKNIKQDKTVLLKRSGQDEVINFLKKNYL
jgi:uncharacterized protein (TIGR00661 family)